MSWTFCLSGKGAELISQYYPPIELSPDKVYMIGLTDVEIANTIPNVTEGSNKFHYTDKKNQQIELILPEGSYEVDAISSLIESHVRGVKIKGNINTMKVEITTDYEIDFEQEGSIGPMLGFTPRKIKAKERVESDRPVDIFPVSVIRVECNLVSDSFVNGKPSHTLFQFPLSVDPGYKLSLAPNHVIFLRINRRVIDEITLRFVDQNGRLINFRGEETSARLHLKEA